MERNGMDSSARELRVHRFEVRSKAGADDPRASDILRRAAALGVRVESARTARVFLVEGPLDETRRAAVLDRLLTDPVSEVGTAGSAPALAGARVIEIHPLPGVMDPVAQSVRAAIGELLDDGGDRVMVSTGWRYDLTGSGLTGEESQRLARNALANPVVHGIHDAPYWPDALPRGHDQRFQLRHIPIRGLTDDELTRLSRDAHLFMSLEEMKAIQSEYARLGREPTDIELETLAQTWSEHCVHKTLKSKVRYSGTLENDPIDWTNGGRGRPGHTVDPRPGGANVTIDNLLKSTVAAATHELIADGVDWTLSVFKDNSGVIAFDDTHGVCVKVETHNHPSAIEPYGGSATGIGGCIRDVLGTGLGAKPIANTDVFCVAFPEGWADSAGKALPPGALHPRRVLTEVVAGVRDYGNRMGIPTVGGGVYFDDRYVGNPLVFAGCVGLIPRSGVKGAARPGDRVIAIGGRTGRDGIHGATFSSAEMEATHADEFAHAVQIGNAIEEKRVVDTVLRARDEGPSPLFHAITDCGAGGFSSAIGEMGGELGAEVQLDRAPLKYDGLSYTEIWISEAQERMVLAVPPENLAALRRICEEESVELADLGRFGTPGRELILRFHDQEVGRLSTTFLADGLPQPVREAVWSGRGAHPRTRDAQPHTSAGRPTSVASSLLKLLAHPNIASKHWIIRQYDHEVQGNTVSRPLVGPRGRGPGDAAVIEPVPGTGRGLAIGCGLQTGVGDPAVDGDPYLMALAAIDECVRNVVCLGADPERIAILDNFCWPSCSKPENLGSLVRAAEGCYDGAKAYRTPFVSGKDSLNNQLKYTDPTTGGERVIEIPPTLLITGIGIVPDLSRVVSMDAKAAGNALLLVGRTTPALGGSHYLRTVGDPGRSQDSGSVPRTDLAEGPRIARAVASLISRGLVRAAHDCSDGGLLVAVTEMLIAAPGLGARLDLARVHDDPIAAAFAETPSRYVLEVAETDLPRAIAVLGDLPHTLIGRVDATARLAWPGAGLDGEVEELAAAWLRPLDW